MALMIGARLGPYEITAAIGAGGMGEVYRARDTRLDRTVAIKILPVQLAGDSQFRERFEREARTISQLTHPHICTLHDVGEHDRTAFLVMEHLEGETLAERLKKGPLPVEQALHHAIEIASALEAAHRQGIVHRDLKPANIMLTNTGIKLLDFGLAKAQAAGARNVLATATPTITAPLTAQGSILGTLQYMAPEQLEGAEADARSDLFAFGAVLYEMVTGRRAFEGKTHASLIGSILKDDPPRLSSQVLAVSPVLDHLVRTCLAKNPEDRFQTAHDVLLELRWARDVGSDAGATGPVLRQRLRTGWRTAAVVGVAGATIAGTAVWILKPVPEALRQVTRFTIAVTGDQGRTGSGSGTAHPMIALPPDGSRLVYAAGRLFLRRMDQTEETPIRGTEAGGLSPVFSPDGQWIVFFANGLLQKVPAAGGVLVPICPVTEGDLYGISWAAADRILFAQRTDGIFEVSATGGAPRRLVAVDKAKGEITRAPQLLPGGDALLFTLHNVASGEWRAARAVVQSLQTGERKVLLDGATDARYVETGHLVFARDSTVFAVPFDAARHELRGSPVAVIEGVALGFHGVSQFAFAANGTMAYVPAGSRQRTLAWLDRKGVETLVPTPPMAYVNPRLSPDGTRAVVGAAEQQRDLWIWDFDRETLTRFTFGPDDESSGIWTPNGENVVFPSRGSEHTAMYSRPASGRGATIRVAKSSEINVALSAIRDGGVLVASQTHDGAWLSLGSWQKENQLRPLVQTEFATVNGRVSPNGRWLAYQSNESGQWEIYVRPFPAVEQGRWQVSLDGGHNPEWRHDGQELFYGNERHGTFMAVRVETDGATFGAGRPAVLFAIKWLFQYGYVFDVSRDGRRFLMTRQNDPAASQIHVVLNWFDELKARVPVEK
jgi:eukaryotic-like serine/threonine-protein kinase